MKPKISVIYLLKIWTEKTTGTEFFERSRERWLNVSFNALPLNDYG